MEPFAQPLTDDMDSVKELIDRLEPVFHQYTRGVCYTAMLELIGSQTSLVNEASFESLLETYVSTIREARARQQVINEGPITH